MTTPAPKSAREIPTEKKFACPVCGPSDYAKSVSTRGVWITHHNSRGEVVDTDLGGIMYGKEPKTVTCSKCGKRRPNPALAAKESR